MMTNFSQKLQQPVREDFASTHPEVLSLATQGSQLTTESWLHVDLRGL